MDFDFDADQQAFIAEVRVFLNEVRQWPDAAEIMCPERESDSILADTPARKAFNRELAKRGYLGLSWPREYGGQERPGIYEYLLNEELSRVGAPLIGKGVGCVGQTLISHGSEKLKQEFLPKILRAEIEFALGYSEPHAGSDLAALKLKAERVDGGWRLNGQKMFTTSAHFADWYWLAARTDFEAPKHKGISLFLVPMDQPGITIHPIETMGEHVTNQVFIDDVFVGDDYLVGEVDRGWTYICEALDYERFTFYTFSPLEEKLKALKETLRNTRRDGDRVIDVPHVRRRMARLIAEVETSKMLQRRVIYAASLGRVPTVEAAMCKLYSTGLHQRLADFALDALGPEGLLHKADHAAPAAGKWEWSYRATALDTIGAGTSEIQKNIIARRELELPLTN
ncbi:acyl-CoA dehydrogenase family protein [Parasphingopyxis marina]|uniref:Acyl-CoA dehydrogenase family protein n=1 Tax=Parasphingopyxis marina TaxID=2761622 RepID=A0A842I0F8_9SPHN|nr:acyl-CoA dehydrogenase family protein [Parasphingopyxis marina]MBC2778976.1 acyl-CoA dehydrogenase family protein [Parasphingopyxis marina]